MKNIFAGIFRKVEANVDRELIEKVGLVLDAAEIKLGQSSPVLSALLEGKPITVTVQLGAPKGDM